MSHIPSVVQVCTICLNTESRLYVMSKYKLGKAYENLTGLSLSNMENVKYLCSECIHRLLNFSKFRYKSLRAHSVMEDLRRNYEVITLHHIRSIDRKKYKLESNIVKLILEPDHCDLYIDKCDEDVSTDLDATVKRVNDAVAIPNGQIHDSVVVGKDHTQHDMELTNEYKNNADIQTEHSFGNLMVKTEKNVYNDHIDIKTEEINDDICNDINDDYLSDSTLVLDTVPIFDEQTSLLNETQNYCVDYAQTLNKAIKPNVKAANKIHMKEKENHKIKIDNINSENKSSKRKYKLHDKLIFETSIDTFDVSNKLFNGEEVSDHECGIKLEPNGDNENTSSLATREIKQDLDKSKKGVEANTYSCNICNYKCKLKIGLTVHKKKHQGEKLFYCENNMQMRKDTEAIPFTCDPCKPQNNANIKTKSSLMIHMRTHASEKSFSCEKCDYKCKIRHTLNVHMTKHTEGTAGPFVCDMCGSKFKYRGNLIRHIKTHTRKEPYACDLCEYKSLNKYYIKQHQGVHMNPQACALCPKKFASKGRLDRHMWVHTNAKNITCDLCDSYFLNTSDLEMHMRSHDTDESLLTLDGERSYACQLCESKFKQRNHLDNHMKTHSGAKPSFACNFCEVKFTQKGSLKKHMHLHTGEKPFACQTCPYKCTAKIDLVKHMRTHTGERPYACTYCDYRSSTSYAMITHTRSHTGEKPFACKLCHYKGSRTSQLVRHMKTHTGEKRFSCHLCDYKCTRRYTLQMHMRVHTGDMFTCDYCLYKTAHKSALVVHIKRHMKLNADGKARGKSNKIL